MLCLAVCLLAVCGLVHAGPHNTRSFVQKDSLHVDKRFAGDKPGLDPEVNMNIVSGTHARSLTHSLTNSLTHSLTPHPFLSPPPSLSVCLISYLVYCVSHVGQLCSTDPGLWFALCLCKPCVLPD